MLALCFTCVQFCQKLLLGMPFEKKKKEMKYFFFPLHGSSNVCSPVRNIYPACGFAFFFLFVFLVFFRSAATRLNIWSPSVCEAFQQQSPCSRHDCWGQARLKPVEMFCKKNKKYWNKSKACSLWVFFFCRCFFAHVGVSRCKPSLWWKWRVKSSSPPTEKETSLWSSVYLIVYIYLYSLLITNILWLSK